MNEEENIFDAIENNDINKVKEYINNNGDINIQNSFKDTPLHLATTRGYDTIVEYLVTNGADIHIQNNNAQTSLFSAVVNGRDTIVQYLIANGANLCIKDMNGFTPLHWAAECGRDAIVQYLVANGAEINIQNWEGHTPLHNAVMEGSDSIVQYLIANGANLCINDIHGETPVNTATTYSLFFPERLPQYINIIKILLPSTNLTNVKDIYKLYKSELNTEVKGKEDIMNDLIMEREYERYFTFCELFSVGTYCVEEDNNNKQEVNSLMIGYEAPLNANEEVRPFPPMFDSNTDESLFDATLVGEIWEYARDFLRAEEFNDYRFI